MDWKKKLKFVIIVAAFATLVLIILSNIFKMTQVSEKDYKTYQQGLYYLNKNDLENAYFNFSNVTKTSAIYEIALLRQALCADELNDYQTATKKYRLFIEKYPDSIFMQKAYYALAQNYFKEKEYNKAEKIFNDIKKLFKDSDYKTASDYYLGEIYVEKSKNIEKHNYEHKQKAKKYFADYLTEAPGGRFSINCAQNLTNLDIQLTQNEYYLIGTAYYKNGLYNEAINNFNLANLPQTWAYRSLAYKQLKNYKKSREIFEKYYPTYNSEIKEELLHQVIDTYINIYPTGIKAGLENALNIATTESLGQDFILHTLCKYENKHIQNYYYKKIYTNYPKGKFASDSVANLFWQAYLKKDYKEAKLLGHMHMRDYQNTIASPKIIYWTAKISELENRRNEAKSLYQKIIDLYPDDYYAYRAYKKLTSTTNNSWKTKPSHRLPEKQINITFPTKYAQITQDNIALIENILKLNDYKLLTEIDKNNKAVLSWINYKEGNISTAARLARDTISQMTVKPNFEDNIYKLAYPLHYQEMINEYSKLFKLDSYLVTAIIREESYFNKDATSSAGAKGLMQIMPTTATYIANIHGYDYNSLNNPNTNIKFGCAYLSYAKKQLNNEDLFAIAAYNGGPNAVKNWRRQLNYNNLDEFIENIPYNETRDYIKKVYRSYWIYKNIY